MTDSPIPPQEFILTMSDESLAADMEALRQFQALPKQAVPQTNGHAIAAPKRLDVQGLTQTRMTRARWLWRDAGDRVPAAELMIEAGRGEVGKSTFALWLAARLSRGELRGEFYGQPRDTVIYSAEDSWEVTTAPRLYAAGADPERIHYVRGTYRPDGQVDGFSWQQDLPLLSELIVQRSAALLIIDPVLNVLPPGAKTNGNEDVNAALRPLVDLAHATGATVLGLAHANKGSDGQMANVVNGSVGWYNVPRAVLFFVHNEQTGERFAEMIKSNLGERPPNLAYQISSADVVIEGQIEQRGVFEPIGITESRAASALAAVKGAGAAPEPIEELEWAAELLRLGERTTDDLKGQLPYAGPGWDSVRKAMTNSGLFTSRRGSQAEGWRYLWRLTDEGRRAYDMPATVPAPQYTPPTSPNSC